MPTRSEAGPAAEAEIVIRALLGTGTRDGARTSRNKAMAALQSAIGDLAKADHRAAAHLNAQLAGVFLSLADAALAHRAPRDFRTTSHGLLTTFQAALDDSTEA